MGHNIWCLRTGPSTVCDPQCMVPQGPATAAYSAASGAAPQAPETTESSSLFTSPSVLQTCPPALEARTGWSGCLALGMRDSNSQRQS